MGKQKSKRIFVYVASVTKKNCLSDVSKHLYRQCGYKSEYIIRTT